MFGFLKLGGAPPAAYNYYRGTSNQEERTILEDLYNVYDKSVKLVEHDFKELRKHLLKNGSSIDSLPDERSYILGGTYEKLKEYGKNKGYPEALISLFDQGY
ncbi:hypothetical protein [Anoxynatronum buryatiense]|uniref:Uncharacterized protein n=1 Tax=Anoxynatronum buryatiense TaxID=489973 RepID=A0AA45WSQ2_9CLOT|nr:hypothetical protein [Anoxynatronum buryatiense]SMP38273.1 hypothetical protein SAMN06296020_10173 [Anoxynatronum buryatiense]